MTTPKEMIEKVAKLLALAEGKGTTPEEAATAAATAQRLMLRYRIEQADVDEVTNDDPMESTEYTPSNYYDGFRYDSQRWEIALFFMIAAATGCYGFTMGRRAHARLTLVGRRGDLEVSRYLWGYLTREIRRLQKEQTRGWSQTQKGHFALGAAHIIGTILKVQAASVSSASGTSAEIVQRGRQDAAGAWYGAQHPEFIMRAGRRGRVPLHGEAYQKGVAAGASVTIRKGMTGPMAEPSRLLRS